MEQGNGINQGLTLERMEETKTAPQSPDQQLLQQARANPAAYIRELTALAERDKSAEAGVAGVLLMQWYTQQKDEGRVDYFQRKVEMCPLSAESHLALAKILDEAGEKEHLRAALAENYAPAIKYILIDRKAEYEAKNWYDFLAAAALRWSTHPENTDIFEREDAAGNAELWKAMPGVQYSKVYWEILYPPKSSEVVSKPPKEKTVAGTVRSAKIIAWVAVILTAISLLCVLVAPVVQVYASYAVSLAAVLIRLLTPPFTYKVQKFPRRLVCGIIWGVAVHYVRIAINLAVTSISPSFGVYAIVTMLFVLILFFGIMIPRKKAEEN